MGWQLTDYCSWSGRVWPLLRPGHANGPVRCDKHWPNGWVCLGFSLRVPWFSPQGYSGRWLLYAQAWLLKKKYPFPTFPPGCFPSWWLKGLGAGWSPEAQKWGGKQSVCSLVREMAPFTTSDRSPPEWLAADFTPRPLSRLFLPVEELCGSQEGMPEWITVRNFFIIIFSSLEVNLLSAPALPPLSQIKHLNFLLFLFSF